MVGYTLTVGKLKISNVTNRKVSILGGTGSGKTSTLKLLALQAFKDKLSVFIFDPLNVIRITGFDRIVVDKKSIGNGKALGKLLNNKFKNPVIIGFKDLLQSELADFANDIFSVWNPHDCIIMIDEIHEFAPETGTSAKYAPEVERAVKHWRNMNVGFVFTSQRSAYVKKNVLALTDYLILFRTVYPNDVEVVKKLITGVVSSERADFIVDDIKTKPFLCGYAIDFRSKEVDSATK